MKLLLGEQVNRTLWSLPMRERELKHQELAVYGTAARSLPMRERELKLWAARKKRGEFESLPMRERELKPV